MSLNLIAPTFHNELVLFTIIAHAVDFTSENHLALHFKRFTGLTPKH